MKNVGYFLLCFFSLLRIAYAHTVLIVGDNPFSHIQAHSCDDTLHIVVPTNRIARKVRQFCEDRPNLKVYTAPLFSHSKKFILYSYGRNYEKITLLPNSKSRVYAIKQCSTLDEFCQNTGIEKGVNLIVDWGDTGYFVVRYADCRSFGDIHIEGLSPLFQQRMERYLKNSGRDV